MKSSITCFCLVLATAFMCGCATGRMADLKDCGGVSVGIGPGLGAHARVGALTHLALGLIGTTKQYGFENRYLSGRWMETEFFWPLAPIYTAFLDESTHERVASLGTTYTRICENDEIINPPPYRSGRWINLKNLDNPKSTLVEHAADIEVGATVLVVSFRLGTNPLEMADFILGFVGLDIARDDTRKMTTSSMVREKQPQ